MKSSIRYIVLCICVLFFCLLSPLRVNAQDTLVVAIMEEVGIAPPDTVAAEDVLIQISDSTSGAPIMSGRTDILGKVTFILNHNETVKIEPVREDSFTVFDPPFEFVRLPLAGKKAISRDFNSVKTTLFGDLEGSRGGPDKDRQGCDNATREIIEIDGSNMPVIKVPFCVKFDRESLDKLQEEEAGDAFRTMVRIPYYSELKILETDTTQLNTDRYNDIVREIKKGSALLQELNLVSVTTSVLDPASPLAIRLRNQSFFDFYLNRLLTVSLSADIDELTGKLKGKIDFENLPDAQPIPFFNVYLTQWPSVVNQRGLKPLTASIGLYLERKDNSGFGVDFSLRADFESGEIKVGIPSSDEEPQSKLLEHTLVNYPNPFMGRTTLAYELASPAPSVKLEIFDALGRSIKVFDQGSQLTGRYEVEWDGTTLSGKSVPPGIYFVRLTHGESSITRPIVAR